VIAYAVVDDALSPEFPLGVWCTASVSVSASRLRLRARPRNAHM
jgi:hypothetical protein